jgi:hypothetical protein
MRVCVCAFLPFCKTARDQLLTRIMNQLQDAEDLDRLAGVNKMNSILAASGKTPVLMLHDGSSKRYPYVQCPPRLLTAFEQSTAANRRAKILMLAVDLNPLVLDDEDEIQQEAAPLPVAAVVAEHVDDDEVFFVGSCVMFLYVTWCWYLYPCVAWAWERASHQLVACMVSGSRMSLA